LSEIILDEHQTNFVEILGVDGTKLRSELEKMIDNILSSSNTISRVLFGFRSTMGEPIIDFSFELENRNKVLLVIDKVVGSEEWISIRPVYRNGEVIVYDYDDSKKDTFVRFVTNLFSSLEDLVGYARVSIFVELSSIKELIQTPVLLYARDITPEGEYDEEETSGRYLRTNECLESFLSMSNYYEVMKEIHTLLGERVSIEKQHMVNLFVMLTFLNSVPVVRLSVEFEYL